MYSVLSHPTPQNTILFLKDIWFSKWTFRLSMCNAHITKTLPNTSTGTRTVFSGFFFLLNINKVVKPKNSISTKQQQIKYSRYPKYHPSNPCSVSSSIQRDPDGLSDIMILVLHFPLKVGDRLLPLLLHFYATRVSSTYKEEASFKILCFGLAECLD